MPKKPSAGTCSTEFYAIILQWLYREAVEVRTRRAYTACPRRKKGTPCPSVSTANGTLHILTRKNLSSSSRSSFNRLSKSPCCFRRWFISWIQILCFCLRLHDRYRSTRNFCCRRNLLSFRRASHKVMRRRQDTDVRHILVSNRNQTNYK